MDNEYELVALAQEENQVAIDLLYKSFEKIIRIKSNKAIRIANHHGIERADIMLEGYLGLDDAIKNYSQFSETSFNTFAQICIDRKIKNYLRKYTGTRFSILNESVTIDETIERTIKDEFDIERIILSGYVDYDFANEVRMTLTEFERNVFDLKLHGCKFQELSKILNKDKKAIYNALQRIKWKIKNFQNYDIVDDFN